MSLNGCVCSRGVGGSFDLARGQRKQLRLRVPASPPGLRTARTCRRRCRRRSPSRSASHIANLPAIDGFDVGVLVLRIRRCRPVFEICVRSLLSSVPTGSVLPSYQFVVRPFFGFVRSLVHVMRQRLREPRIVHRQQRGPRRFTANSARNTPPIAIGSREIEQADAEAVLVELRRHVPVVVDQRAKQNPRRDHPQPLASRA